MNAKKMMVLTGLTAAFAGSAVADDFGYWRWDDTRHASSWNDDWDDDWEEDIVSIPERGKHVRPKDASLYIAQVVATNRTNQWVKIVAKGQVLTWLGPLERRTLRLDANVGQIQAVVGERVVRSKTIRSGKKDVQAFRIEPPKTGLVQIKNTLRYKVRVLVDGRIVGTINPSSTAQFELSTGRQKVELVAVNGRGQTRKIGRKSIQVDPFETDTLVTPEMRRKRQSRRSRRGHSHR